MALTIKQWRGVKELTQKQMADKIGVDVTTYNRYEQKNESIPLGTFVKILKALEVKIDEVDFFCQ